MVVIQATDDHWWYLHGYKESFDEFHLVNVELIEWFRQSDWWLWRDISLNVFPLLNYNNRPNPC